SGASQTKRDDLGRYRWSDTAGGLERGEESSSPGSHYDGRLRRLYPRSSSTLTPLPQAEVSLENPEQSPLLTLPLRRPRDAKRGQLGLLATKRQSVWLMLPAIIMNAHAMKNMRLMMKGYARGQLELPATKRRSVLFMPAAKTTIAHAKQGSRRMTEDYARGQLELFAPNRRNVWLMPIALMVNAHAMKDMSLIQVGYVVGDTDALDLLDQLTDEIENIGDGRELTGDEIGDLVDLLDDLFEDFFLNFTNSSDAQSRSHGFLTNFTRVIDEALLSFNGWLSLAPYGLKLSSKLLEWGEELQFRNTTTALIVEVGSGKMENLTGPIVFPSSDRDTYFELPLPLSFRDNGRGKLHLCRFQEEKAVNSKLLTFALKLNETVILTDPATLTFRNSRVPQTPLYKDIWRDLHEGEDPAFIPRTQQCAFWNFNGTGFWDKEGLQEVSSDNEYTVCRTYHLTNFAVLMSLHGYVGRGWILELFTMTLLPCSIICLAMAIFLFQKSKKSTKEQNLGLNIHQQLCFWLLLGYLLVFLVIDRRFFLIPPMVCEISAVFLHFVFLSCFAWMALEGWRLHTLLHMVKRMNLSLRVNLLVGYSAPVFVVGITAAVSFGTQTHGYGEGEFCWLSSPYYIWTFAAPVLFVLVANSILMIRVIKKARALSRLPTGMQRHQVQRSHKSSMVRILSLSSLLGIGWLFGVLQMEVSPAFSYLFVLINGSQGIGIFIFYCYRQPDMRDKLKRYLKVNILSYIFRHGPPKNKDKVSKFQRIKETASSAPIGMDSSNATTLKEDLGDECEPGPQACKPDNSECVASDGEPGTFTCQCKHGFLEENGEDCKIAAGGDCQNNNDCVKHADCKNHGGGQKSCECDEGSVEEAGRCKVPPGGNCEGDEDCVENAKCSDGECRCGAGFAEQDQRCVPDDGPGLGEPCDLASGNCAADNAVCDPASSTCRCEGGYIQDGGACRRPNLGEECTAAIGCANPNAECIASGETSTCQCSQGFALDETECKVEVGGPCTDDGDCVDNADCEEDDGQEICGCKNHYIEEGGRCKVGLGEKCDSSEECLQNAECLGPNMKCHCSEGFVEQDDHCVVRLRYLSDDIRQWLPTRWTPFDSVMRLQGSLTHNGIQQINCGMSTSLMNRFRKLMRFGKALMLTKAPFEMRLEFFLMPANGPGLGEPCDPASGNCATDNAFCDPASSTCRCEGGYIQVGDACTLDENPGHGGGGIGEMCRVDDDCKRDGHLACNLALFKCDCADGFIFNTDILVCVTGRKGLGDACTNDGDCNGNLHYHCDEAMKICTCGDGYRLDVETLQCEKSPGGLGDECATEEDCDADFHLGCHAGLGKCDCVDGFSLESLTFRCVPNLARSHLEPTPTGVGRAVSSHHERTLTTSPSTLHCARLDAARFVSAGYDVLEAREQTGDRARRIADTSGARDKVYQFMALDGLESHGSQRVAIAHPSPFVPDSPDAPTSLKSDRTVCLVQHGAWDPGEGEFGDPCLEDADCDKDENLACNVTAFRCECARGFVFRGDFGMCVVTDLQTHFEELGRWLPGSIPLFLGFVRKPKPFHEFAETGDGCSLFVQEGSQDSHLGELGDPCQRDEDCRSDEYLVCDMDHYVCNCPEGSLFDGDIRQCVLEESWEPSEGQFGYPCLEDKDCDEYEALVCSMEISRCVCADGYVLNVDTLTCEFDESWEASEGQYGFPCQDDEDCGEDEALVCNAELFRCDCADGYVFDADTLTCESMLDREVRTLLTVLHTMETYIVAAMEIYDLPLEEVIVRWTPALPFPEPRSSRKASGAPHGGSQVNRIAIK
ncbi:unnamed protein product, partial [Darwinula stevensoni]